MAMKKMVLGDKKPVPKAVRQFTDRLPFREAFFRKYNALKAELPDAMEPHVISFSEWEVSENPAF